MHLWMVGTLCMAFGVDEERLGEGHVSINYHQWYLRKESIIQAPISQSGGYERQ